MKLKISRRSLLAAGVGSTASIAIPTLAQQGPIRIGGIMPFSGPQARSGAISKIAGQVVVDQVNKSGGVMGRPIEIVWRDDKANATESAAAARDLLGSGINLLFGGTFTATTLAVMPVVAQEKAVFTALTAATLSITHENFDPHTFRLYPNAYISYRGLARIVAMKNPNITRWSGIIPEAEYGFANWGAFSAGLKEFYQKLHGKQVEIAEPVLTKFGATDFKNQVGALMRQPSEGLFSALIGNDFFTFLAQAKPFGLFNKIKVFCDSGQDVGVGKAALANTPANTWSPSPWYYGDPKANDLSKQLYRAMVAANKDPYPVGTTWTTHTAVSTYVAAMRAAKSVDPAAVIRGLENMAFETAGGPFRYRREDHQGLPTMGFVKLGPSDKAPGWAVTDFVTSTTADLAEPATPGKKWTPPA
ncbi:MAG: ABC transporter substrate-binding protein [Burkholderiaceae bacterium]|nr:ABC transporter substrate-binding protein [Desulfobacterales bacterium]MDP3136064.1 ABC transporter substrate-binding protein [Burkholderiaceae bacterium]